GSFFFEQKTAYEIDKTMLPKETSRVKLNSAVENRWPRSLKCCYLNISAGQLPAEVTVTPLAEPECVQQGWSDGGLRHRATCDASRKGTGEKDVTVRRSVASLAIAVAVASTGLAFSVHAQDLKVDKPKTLERVKVRGYLVSRVGTRGGGLPGGGLSWVL